MLTVSIVDLYVIASVTRRVRKTSLTVSEQVTVDCWRAEREPWPCSLGKIRFTTTNISVEPDHTCVMLSTSNNLMFIITCLYCFDYKSTFSKKTKNLNFPVCKAASLLL